MSTSVSQLIALVEVQGAPQAVKGLLGVGAASDDAGTKLRNLTVGATLIAGAALVAVGAKAVEMAANFQQSTNLLITSAGETTQNIGMIRQGLLDMSVATATSTDDLVKGMFNVESAGYRGAAALMVEKAAAEGAKVENADLTATTGILVTAMHNFHEPASQAVDVMNSFRMAASMGVMHLDDLTGALKNVLPIASQAGVSLTDVEAALSTMSLAGDRGASAGTHLSQMLTYLLAPSGKATSALKEVGLTTQQISDEMKVSLPGTVEMITQAVGEKFPVGSAKYIAALSAIVGGNKSMKAMLELSGISLKTFTQDAAQLGPTMQANSTAVDGWSVVQGNFNFKLDAAKNAVSALMIGIGTALLPVISHLLDVITPAITAFSGWVTSGHAVADVMNFIAQHAQTMVPLLSGAAVVIGGLLVAAFFSLAAAAWTALAPILVFAAPFILVGAAVAGLAAIFMHFYQTSAPFKAFIDNLVGGLKQAWSVIVANFVPAMQAVGAAIQTYVLPILSQIGAFIVSNFMPVWKQLVDLWNNQLVPLGKQLMAALQPLMPLFIGIAEIVGVVLVVALGLVVGVIAAIIKGLAGFLSGLVIVIGGIVQVITGVIQVIAGIIRVIIDIVTLNFGDLGPALGQIWQGIINIFAGAWTIIAGLFLTAWFTISGIVVGFVQGIIGFFTGLYNDIVGHSIIPDMINGIINWFAQLPGRIWAFVLSLINYVKTGFLIMWNAAVTIVTQLVNSVIQWFSSLPGRVWAFVLNLINYIRTGFTIMWNAAVTIVTQLVNSVVQWFSSLPGRAISAVQSLQSRLAGFFGGLASQALTWGKNIIQGIINGINNMLGAVGNAAQHVASTIANFLPHSPAKEGPLSKLNEFGPALVKGFSQGIIESTPMLRAAVTHMVQPLAVATVSPQYRLAPVAATSSGGGYGNQTIIIELDGNVLAQVVGDRQARIVRLKHGRKAF